MQQHHEHSRGRGWGRRLAVVAPATLVLTLGLGTAVAMAAPAPSATSHGNGTPNLGIGQGKTDANVAHGASLTAPVVVATDSAGATGHVSDGTAATVGDPGQPQPLSGADTNTGGANGQCSGADTGVYCSTRGHGTGEAQPSLNGNGDGTATGKPCEACVGKADNKNPPGQEKSDPMGTFPNNGYECDHNNGIGKGNPAHSGCAGTTTVTCPSGQVMVNGTCTTPTTPGCPSGQVMVNGTCTTPTTPGCSSGQVMVNGTCTTPTTPTTSVTSGGTPGAGTTTTTPTTSGSTPGAGTTTTCPSGAEMVNGACVLGEKVTRVANEGPGQGTVGAPVTSVLGERVTRTPSATAPAALPFTGADVNGLLASGIVFALLGMPLLVVGRRRRTA